MIFAHANFKAFLWMLASILSFVTMAVAARQIFNVHNTFEIMAWRSAVGLVIVCIVLTLRRCWNLVRRERLPRHLLRNAVHFTGQNLWFWALSMIPLAQVFALEFTSPIWVIFLAPLILGESLTRAKLVAGLLGFAGALIVARPDFNAIDLGVLAAASAAVSFAITNLLTKTLTRHESTLSILFWLTSLQLLMGIAAAFYHGPVNWPTAVTLPWLVLIGMAGLSAHYCLTTALSLAPAGVVIPIDFLRLPVAALVGWWLFGESVAATLFLGAALILLGIWINLRAANRAGVQQPGIEALVTPRQ